MSNRIKDLHHLVKEFYAYKDLYADKRIDAKDSE